jgi:hypothetical protein
MGKIPGSIRVECTPILRNELKDFGSERCILIHDEIKAMPGVRDVWFPEEKTIDIIVELDVASPEQAEEIENKIKEIEGVQNVRTALAIEA